MSDKTTFCLLLIFISMSKYEKITKSKLEEVIDDANTISDIAIALGYTVTGYSLKKIRTKLKEFDIEFESKKCLTLKRPIREYLVENCEYYNKARLKRNLLKEGLLNYHCYICNNEGEWLGNPLSLHLDHINGVNNDNRLENLRMLCPNCHTQTDTYCGKNNKKLG